MLEGSFIKSKAGPLPVWAWMGLGLGAAVAFASWQRNKKAGEEEAAGPTSGPLEVGDLPESLQPTFAFVAGDTILNQSFAPPVGGRPPNAPAPPSKPGQVTLPAPKPAPSIPKPSPKPPVGKTVTVAKWNSRNAPWNSTVWGIAHHYFGNKVPWQAIWNAPQNASLKARRKKPELIQPGDRIFVPGAK